MRDLPALRDARARRSRGCASVDAGEFALGEDVAVHGVARIFVGQPRRPKRIGIERVDMEMVVVRRLLLWRTRTAESCPAEIVHADFANGRPFIQSMLRWRHIVEHPMR